MSHVQLRLLRLPALLLCTASSVVVAAPGGVPAQIEALASKVETIQSQQVTSQAQLATLLTAVTSLTSASNSLQTAITSLTSTDATLQSKIAGLQSSVGSLQSTTNALSSQLAVLQTASDTGVTAVSRGSVLFDGTIISGSGFKVLIDPNNTGRYVIAYTTPRFSAKPSCVVSAQQEQLPPESANFYCKLANADAVGLSVQCYAPPELGHQVNGFFVHTSASLGNFEFICAL